MKVCPLEKDSPDFVIYTTKESLIEKPAQDCKCIEASPDSEELVTSEYCKTCSGYLSYGHAKVWGDDRLVAIRKNYHSADNCFDKAEECLGAGTVESATHYDGSQRVVCLPCTICNFSSGWPL